MIHHPILRHKGAAPASSVRPFPTDIRYSDRPLPLSTRLSALIATGALVMLLLLGALLRWQNIQRTVASPTLSTFDVAPPQAPPAPPSEIPPGPVQVQKDQAAPRVDAPTLSAPLVQLPNPGAALLPTVQPAADPGPPVEQTTAPEASPRPEAARASDIKPTWEGQVLAALNRAKRYPLEAKRNRQQGTAWIRFIIDRDGGVRGVRLERSSGFDALDREALALPLRAQPLPSPPPALTGERAELVVPVEFFLP